MQCTSESLHVLVGEEKVPITLTDSAVEAVQKEAAGKLVSALASVWEVDQHVQPGEGFAEVEINDLLGLRDALLVAREMTEVLIECRPLDDLEPDE